MTYSFNISAACMRGTSRYRNDDAVCINGSFLDQNEFSESEFPVYASPNGTIIMVADGMGGHPKGAWASRTALKTIIASWENNPKNLNITDAISNADRILKDYSNGPKRPGTTLSGVLIDGKICTSFNVGDSPIILIRHGQIAMLSEEDRPPGAATNILSQCLGGSADETPAPHTKFTALQSGDTIILSTDGVSDHVGKNQWIEVLNQDCMASAPNICRLARENGSDDDTSAVIVRVESE